MGSPHWKGWLFIFFSLRGSDTRRIYYMCLLCGICPAVAKFMRPNIHPLTDSAHVIYVMSVEALPIASSDTGGACWQSGDGGKRLCAYPLCSLGENCWHPYSIIYCGIIIWLLIGGIITQYLLVVSLCNNLLVMSLFDYLLVASLFIYILYVCLTGSDIPRQHWIGGGGVQWDHWPKAEARPY